MFGLSLSTQLVLANSRDRSIELQAGQGQVMGLTAGVLPHLLDADVSPALLFILGGVQRPRGRGPDAGHRALGQRQHHQVGR